jgi:hypothetical protein
MKSSARSTLYRNLCIVLGIGVLVLGYYQFFGESTTAPEAPKKINGYTPSTATTTTGNSGPKPAPKAVPSTPMVIPTIPSELSGSTISSSPLPNNSSPGSTNTASWATVSTEIVYTNDSIGYTFNMPRNSYFAWFGAQDGAAHTVGIATGTGVTSFAEATARVWYYPQTIVPELAKAEGGFYQDPRSNMTYLALGSGSVRIEGDMESAVVNTIISSIKRTK